MKFDDWYTKEIRVKLDKYNMRKDGGEAAARYIWEAAIQEYIADKDPSKWSLYGDFSDCR